MNLRKDLRNPQLQFSATHSETEQDYDIYFWRAQLVVVCHGQELVPEEYPELFPTETLHPKTFPGYYRHYKGKLYFAMAEAWSVSDNEGVVVYLALDKPGEIWVRPHALFASTVETTEGRQKRFTRETVIL